MASIPHEEHRSVSYSAVRERLFTALLVPAMQGADVLNVVQDILFDAHEKLTPEEKWRFVLDLTAIQFDVLSYVVETLTNIVNSVRAEGIEEVEYSEMISLMKQGYIGDLRARGWNI